MAAGRGSYAPFLYFVITAARRMCFSLSALRLSRYDSVKSNLKPPLKLSRWPFSSDFLSEAIDEANFSYEPADDITLTPVKKVNPGTKYTSANYRCKLTK